MTNQTNKRNDLWPFTVAVILFILASLLGAGLILAGVIEDTKHKAGCRMTPLE
jgi:hypothetical protein